MRGQITRSARILLAAAALGSFAPPVHAQTPLESSSEARFQLDLHVSEQALTPCCRPASH